MTGLANIAERHAVTLHSFADDTQLSGVNAASFYYSCVNCYRPTGSSFTIDDELTATLVRAFVTSRVDYCNLLLAGARKTDRLCRDVVGRWLVGR